MIRNDLLTICSEVGDQFYQRADVIRSMMVAALAKEHVLLLGPPGTAKSDLTREFTSRLVGAEYFDWLLSKFTQPEELFGPVSIAGLKTDSFRRVTAGKLPTAHVGFLDEIFKANSAILNALLTLVNERVYHNGTARDVAPLKLVVGASNELPADESLGAFYDRFLVRHWVEPIQGAGDWMGLMMRTAGAPDTRTTVSLDAWELACDAVAAVTIAQETVEAAFKLKKSLELEGIVASDRRWVKAFKLARAAAWLDGETEVTPDHCEVWKHVLWNEPEQQASVTAAVNKLTAAEVVAARELYDALSAKLDEVEPLEGDAFEAKAAAVNTDGRRTVTALSDLWKKARSPNAKRQVAAMGKEMKTRVAAIRDRLANMGEIKTSGF
jgi:MoxR-like ATPase